MKFKFAVTVVALGTLLGACETAQLPISYTPSSTLTATGAVQVGDFKYMPAITGKMKPNQIHNTAMGSVIIEKNIDVFFHDAVFTEMRFVGIKVGTGDKKLKGTIKEFLIDDLGYSVDWTLDVDYVLEDASGKVVYQSDKLTKNHTAKFANAFVALNNQIKQNVETLITDPDFAKLINADTAPAAAPAPAPTPAPAPAPTPKP